MLNIDESADKIIQPNNEHDIKDFDEESQDLYNYGDYVHAYRDEFNNICIDCDLPGRDKDNIHSYLNGYRDLTIIADEYNTYGYYLRERVHVSFHLPYDMDYDNSTATYHNGVLTILVKRLNSKNNETFETPIM